MRVSAARAVTDLSGNMRIHIFPIFLTTREITIRDDSICLAVIQPGAIDYIPNLDVADGIRVVGSPGVSHVQFLVVR